MVDEAVKALRHVYNGVDTENQWNRATNAVQNLSELDRARVWIALSDPVKHRDSMAVAMVMHSQLRELYKRCVADALQRKRVEEEPTQERIYIVADKQEGPGGIDDRVATKIGDLEATVSHMNGVFMENMSDIKKSLESMKELEEMKQKVEGVAQSVEEMKSLADLIVSSFQQGFDSVASGEMKEQFQKFTESMGGAQSGETNGISDVQGGDELVKKIKELRDVMFSIARTFGKSTRELTMAVNLNRKELKSDVEEVRILVKTCQDEFNQEKDKVIQDLNSSLSRIESQLKELITK